MEDSCLSAFACVKRLTDLGFTIAMTGESMTLLRKEHLRVIIPHVTIEPEMLRAVLRSADVTEVEFFRGVRRSGIYASTVVDAGASAPGPRKRAG